MIKFFITLFLSAFFLSCSGEDKEGTPVKIIDLNSVLQEAQVKLPLSSIAIKVEYIPLETDSSSLVGRIIDLQEQIKFTEDRVFLSDKTRLLSFDLAGNFLAEIGDMGRGPNEFSDLQDFAILPGEELVAIYSARNQKVYLYGFDGKTRNDVQDVGFWPIHMNSVQNNLVFANPKGRRDMTDYKALTLMNLHGNIEGQILPRDFEREIEDEIALSSRQIFYKLEDSLSFWEFNYDTIWRVSHDYKMTPAYYLDYEQDKLPQKYLLEKHAQKNEEQSQFVKLWRYVESPRYMFFRFGNKKMLNHIYYDKTTGEKANLRFDRNNTGGYHFAFENDLDGGLPFWPDGNATGNKVFMLVHRHKLKEYLERNEGQDEVLQTKREPLKKMIENGGETDNPILMVVTLQEPVK